MRESGGNRKCRNLNLQIGTGGKMKAKRAKKSKGLRRAKKLEPQKPLKGTMSDISITKHIDTSTP